MDELTESQVWNMTAWNLKLIRGRGRQPNSTAHAFPHHLMTLCTSLLQELIEELY